MKNGFLRLQGVCKRFGRVEALRSVSLELGPTELLVVLGPTGAGKTTLLRTIAGLEMPEAGRVEMGGEDITHRLPAGRGVALVFQNFSLYPDWTVRRNMEFPLRAPGRRLKPAEIEERIRWAGSLLRIGDLLERRVEQLSGGEMQRVAIGRAIVRRPRLFLMDEPLTNLDAKLREALRVELVVLQRELGIPMIYVTHDQAEAMSMGDRIAVLEGGRVLQTGGAKEIYLRPLSPVVARQLGRPPINILEIREVEGYWVAADGTRVMPAGGRKGEMLLGIRPEDIALAGGQDPGLVRVIEDAGHHWILLVEWAGCEIHVLAAREQSWKPGDTVLPLVDPERVVLWERGVH